MYGRKVKLRFLFVALILITLILTVFLVLKSLEENVVYFQSPSEIKALSELDKKKIRVGGMVKKNSISIKSSEVKFIITDFKNEINVTYSGAIPNLFEEEKGVVAEGFLKHRKLITTKKNCKNVNDKILVSSSLEFLKFFAEKYKRTNPKKSPGCNE